MRKPGAIQPVGADEGVVAALAAGGAVCHAHNVYPLNDETTSRALPERQPSLLDGVTSTTYFTSHVRIPERSTVNFKNTSFDLTAYLHVPARRRRPHRGTGRG